MQCVYRGHIRAVRRGRFFENADAIELRNCAVKMHGAPMCSGVNQ